MQQVLLSGLYKNQMGIWYILMFWVWWHLFGVSVVQTNFRKLMRTWHRSVSKLGLSCSGSVQSYICSYIWRCWWGHTLALWHSQLWVAELRWSSLFNFELFWGHCLPWTDSSFFLPNPVHLRFFMLGRWGLYWQDKQIEPISSSNTIVISMHSKGFRPL